MKLFIKRIARDKIGEYTVSTVLKDNTYETAIKLKNREYIVVAQYADETRAKIGHKYWIEFATTKPVYATNTITGKQEIF